MSASNFEYIGAPKPGGIPFALISITAPQDEPAFLTLNKYFSHKVIIDLSGQKKDFYKLFCHSTFSYHNQVYLIE